MICFIEACKKQTRFCQVNLLRDSQIIRLHSTPVSDDEFGEKRVCVALDGQEAELTFIDHPTSEMSVGVENV